METSIDEQSFRLLAETVPQMMWISRSDGQMTYWNERFKAYAGLRPSDDIGRGWETIVHPADLVAVALRWAAATAAPSEYEQQMRLQRADGVYRWFSARAVPVFDAAGAVDRFVGTVTDIDDAERAARSLEFLDGISDLLGAQVEASALLAQIAERAVPSLADWCAIYRFGADARIEPVAIAHRSAEAAAVARQMLRQYPPRPTDPVSVAALGGHSLLVENVSRDFLSATAHDRRHLELLAGFDIASAVIAPLVARGVVHGAIHLACEPGRAFGPGDLLLAEILGKRLGTAIDNIAVYERERLISNTFQQAALSHALPTVPGLDLHAVYVAAGREAEVGGDWYDAFILDDGNVVISIGDVAGKGLEAAVLMGSLRQAIRVVALKGFSPAAILEATSRLVQYESSEKFATAFVAIVDPATWSLRYATAAHPMPILRRPDGSTSFLSAEPSPPLGLIEAMPREYAVANIPAQSLLVLYTDGLVEGTRDLDAGEARLCAAVASNAVLHSGDPARLIRDTVLHGDAHDDVAVLTVAFGRSKRWSFDALDAMSAHGARSTFLAALRAEGDPDGDYIGCEVIFGELIGNVVRHAPGPIDITLDWSEREPILHVIDRGPGFAREPKLPEDDLAESGRGLFIIDTLARGFAAVPMPGRGTHATVRLPVARRQA